MSQNRATIPLEYKEPRRNRDLFLSDESESAARKSSEQQPARKIRRVEITEEQHTVVQNHSVSSDALRAGYCSPSLRAADPVP
jgi:hypothetical protein